ncbi:SRPBCC domain-containing protein [Pedobacter sp.]|jgi:uncharacterized protein YndB with AHSA1/START domain|uniref:SRPBCC family protein n=1 Tax=Pedobacter sp. TaxID=1411316 RepID=UPI002BE4B55D|nr:SRPBCC domain-containing protein [Pedobacter sp.]HWW39889.1 SRPBCC domain-containing protein [Pedobacter sp.]
MEIIRKTVLINATTPAVWDTLTTSSLIQQWTHDTPIEIQTDWKVGSPIIMSGDLHGIPFSNSGNILAFEPNTKLSYSFLSSLSNLPNIAESHCILEFNLIPQDQKTRLDLTISNFPDQVIRKHLELYWGPTLELIRKQAES